MKEIKDLIRSVTKNWNLNELNSLYSEKPMNINEVFPSNYLKASDLNGKKIKCTIEDVVIEEIGQDRKPVMHFAGKQKGLVLNKSKAAILSATFTSETGAWIGREVAIYPTKVAYQGQMVDSIGIEALAPLADDSDEPGF